MLYQLSYRDLLLCCDYTIFYVLLMKFLLAWEIFHTYFFLHDMSNVYIKAGESYLIILHELLNNIYSFWGYGLILISMHFPFPLFLSLGWLEFCYSLFILVNYLQLMVNCCFCVILIDKAGKNGFTITVGVSFRQTVEQPKLCHQHLTYISDQMNSLLHAMQDFSKS